MDWQRYLVFNLVIVATMRNAPVIFSKILPTIKSPAMSSRWAMQKSMVKQYLTYLLQLLKNLTDSDMLYLAIKEAEKCSLYWACFDRMAKLYMKVLLDHWANAALSDHVRIQAFLALRSLSVTHVDTNRLQETHYLELCLKNIYLTFVRNCKDTTVHTLPAINMMRNLAVQLYSINPDISYQQAFVYIRQLAIHLRSAMQLKTKASWCLCFWVMKTLALTVVSLYRLVTNLYIIGNMSTALITGQICWPTAVRTRNHRCGHWSILWPRLHSVPLSLSRLHSISLCGSISWRVWQPWARPRMCISHLDRTSLNYSKTLNYSTKQNHPHWNH